MKAPGLSVEYPRRVLKIVADQYDSSSEVICRNTRLVATGIDRWKRELVCRIAKTRSRRFQSATAVGQVANGKKRVGAAYCA